MPEKSKNYIVIAEDVQKTYHSGTVQVEALRGINLKIKTGEMLTVMGSSGCGKTTLLNCLSTLDNYSSGRVIIEGRDLSHLSENEKADLRSEKMGFIFQSYNLLPVLSAVENVELPLIIRGSNRASARVSAEEALMNVGLEGKEEHKPSELSGGEQQRVTIARSLVNNPILIWADEPSGNLDSKNSKQIMKLLRQLNKKFGQTYVIVTHDSRVANTTDRIVRMESGKIIKK